MKREEENKTIYDDIIDSINNKFISSKDIDRIVQFPTKLDKIDFSKIEIEEGVDYRELYITERNKRLEPFKDDIKELTEAIDVGYMSALGLNIPKPSDLEIEYFYKDFKSRLGITKQINEKVDNLKYDVYTSKLVNKRKKNT